GYLQMSVGQVHACALRPDGSIVCWGEGLNGQTAAPPGPWFAQVSAGFHHSCALYRTGQVTCWGEWVGNGQRFTFGQSFAPPDFASYTEVSARGANHTCALRTDRTLACWGANF